MSDMFFFIMTSMKLLSLLIKDERKIHLVPLRHFTWKYSTREREKKKDKMARFHFLNGALVLNGFQEVMDKILNK